MRISVLRKFNAAVIAAVLVLSGGAVASAATSADAGLAVTYNQTAGAKGYAVANGVDAWTFTVNVTYDGVPFSVPDPTSMSVVPSSTAVTVSPIENPETGLYTAQVRATLPGAYTLTILYGVSPIGQYSVFFYASEPDPSQSTLVVTPASTDTGCGATATVTATATIRDSQGTLMPRGVQVTYDYGGDAPATSKTDDDGVATLTITYHVLSEPVAANVSASIAVNDALVEITGSGASVSINPTQPCQTSLVVSSDTATVPADGVSAWTGIMQVASALGDPIMGKPNGVNFSFRDSTGQSTNNVQLSTVTDNGNGAYTVQFTSMIPGTYTVRGAWYQYEAPEKTITFTPLTVGTAVLTPTTQTVIQPCDGTKAEAILTATVHNDQGYPVSGQVVTFVVGTNAPVTGTTGSEGTTKLTISNEGNQLSSTVEVHASLASGDELSGSPATVIFQLDQECVPDPWSLDAILSAATQVVGQAISVTITAKDTTGAPIIGLDPTKLMVATSPNVSVSPIVANGDGTYTGYMTTSQPGDYTLQLGFNGRAYGTPGSFSFTPAVDPVRLEVSSAGVVRANGYDSWVGTVTALNEDGTPIPNAEWIHFEFFQPGSNVQLDQKDAGLIASAVRINGDGTYTAYFGSKVAGSFEVRAVVNGDLTTNRVVVSFVEVPSAQPGAELTLGNVQMYNDLPETTARVVVHNQAGQPLAGVKVDFTVPATDTMSAHQCYTDSAGRCEISIGLYGPGDHQVTAAINGQPVGGSPAVVRVLDWTPVITDPYMYLGGFTVVAGSDPVLANGTSAWVGTVTFQPTMLTPFSEVMTGKADLVRVTASSPDVTVSAPVDNGDGTYTVRMTSTKPGTYMVTEYYMRQAVERMITFTEVTSPTPTQTSPTSSPTQSPTTPTQSPTTTPTQSPTTPTQSPTTPTQSPTTPTKSPTGPTGPTIGLSIPALMAGQTMMVSGTGWAPAETVSVIVHSTPLNLGTFTVNPDGTLPDLYFTVPADFEPGPHTVTAVGSISGVQETTFTVLAPAPASPTPTPPVVVVSTGGTALTGLVAPSWGFAGLVLISLAFILWRRSANRT